METVNLKAIVREIFYDTGFITVQRLDGKNMLNLNIRGVKTFISRKHGKTHIAIDKNLDSEFSGYYFCEEYMYRIFN